MLLLRRGCRGQQRQWRGGGSGGVSVSDVSNMIASAIQAALAAIDHLTANTITATNSTLGSATVTTLHVTGTATLDTPLAAASGGTGISTAPTYGQLLMGQSNGTYALVSTSSLGIPGGTGAWGAITGTLSNQSDLQNALNAKLSLAQWYATTTSALAEGSNLYFTNARADARINATSSIGTLLAAPNLASVGTVTSGTWNAAAIGIPYGGTGLTSAPSYGQLLLGQSNGTYALVCDLIARHHRRRWLRHRQLRHPRPVRVLQRRRHDPHRNLEPLPCAIRLPRHRHHLPRLPPLPQQHRQLHGSHLHFLLHRRHEPRRGCFAIAGNCLSFGNLTGTVGISQGGLGFGTAPAYGQLLMGQANGTYTWWPPRRSSPATAPLPVRSALPAIHRAPSPCLTPPARLPYRFPR